MTIKKYHPPYENIFDNDNNNNNTNNKNRKSTTKNHQHHQQQQRQRQQRRHRQRKCKYRKPHPSLQTKEYKRTRSRMRLKVKPVKQKRNRHKKSQKSQKSGNGNGNGMRRRRRRTHLRSLSSMASMTSMAAAAATTTTVRRRTTNAAVESVSSVTIGLCTSVRNELPYLFEWIEFHRTIQKIDRIWIFDDQSSDRTSDLRHFYGPQMHDYPQVTVIDINDIKESTNHTIYKDRSGRTQLTAWNECMIRAIEENLTWLGIWDVDEFVYALGNANNNNATATATAATIKSYVTEIAINEPDVHQIRIPLIAYGASLSQLRFRYDLEGNVSVNGNGTVNREHTDTNTVSNTDIKVINDNKNGFIRTVIGEYLYRAPCAQALDSKKFVQFTNRYYNECDCFRRHENPSLPSVCTHAWHHKSLFKPQLCDRAYTHQCEEFTSPGYQLVDSHRLRGHHYFQRSFETMFSKEWNTKRNKLYARPFKKIMLLSPEINAYFRAVYDPYLADRYHPQIFNKLAEFIGCEE